jgi:hypothetical protein
MGESSVYRSIFAEGFTKGFPEGLARGLAQVNAIPEAEGTDRALAAVQTLHRHTEVDGSFMANFPVFGSIAVERIKI